MSTRYELCQVQPQTLWRHLKGGLYLVLGIVEDSTNGNEGIVYVRYWSFTHKKETIRKCDEFLDGRFMPVENEDELLVHDAS